MKKKFLALLLCLSMIIVQFGTVIVSAEAVDTAALYNADSNTYTVANADELIAVVAEINSAEANYGRNITLSANIDLTGKTFTPLKSYSGTIDGANKTIKGLVLTAAADNNGLIVSGVGCTVKNLVIDGAKVESSKSNIGALIGISAGTVVIDNCTLKNSTVTGTTTGSSRVGGFIGYVAKDKQSKVTISNSNVVDCSITSGKEIVGGMVGYAESAPTFNIVNCTVIATLSGSAYVGGVIGRTAGTPAVFKNCTVNANITSANSAGGISGGESGGSASNTITFENCFVAGVYKNTGSNPKRSGGIIGYASSDTLIFKNCISIAECDGALAGNPNKNVMTIENCAGDRAFIGLLTVSDTFKITESGSEIIGVKEALLVGQHSLTSGKTLTINGTTYATDAEVKAAVAAFKAPAAADADLLALITRKFAVQDDPATEGVNEKAVADALIAEAQSAVLTTAVEPLYNGETKTYTVATADELIAVVAAINSADRLVARNVTLAADIDLTGKAFTPIATYSGTFDGNNKTISGMSLIGTEADLGMIKIGAGCTVKNLTIDGATVHSTNTSGGAGAVIGSATSGSVTIDNVTLSDSVIVGTGPNVGGLVGQFKAVKTDLAAVKNSTVVNTIIEGRKQVGGIIGGMMRGTGYFDSCKVIDTYIATVNNQAQVGGIVGRVEAVGNVPACVIVNSTVNLNTDVVLSKAFKSADKKDVTFEVSPEIISTGNHDVGGLVGHNLTNLAVADCIVNAKITAEGKHAGGILGRVNAKNVTVDVARCVINATVAANTADGAAGAAGVVGTINQDGSKLTVTDCLINGSINRVGGPAAGVVGVIKTAATITDTIVMADLTSTTEKIGLWTANGTEAEVTNGVDATAKNSHEILADVMALFAAEDDAATEGVNEKEQADALIEAAKAIVMDAIVATKGYQTDMTNAANGTYDIRFLSYVDSIDYDKIGLQITVTIDGVERTAIYTARNIYKSVYAVIGDESEEPILITIEDLGDYESGYIMAVVITDVPTSVTNFSVTPFVKTLEGETITGSSCTATVEISAN